MNKKLLACLWLSLVVLAGCTTKDISSDVTRDTIIQTWEVITTWNLVDTGSLITWEDTSIYDDYAPVSPLDETKFWQQRVPEKWFVVNDKNWKGEYYIDRNWIYLGTMGVQSADIMYGYMSWNIYMDLGTEVVQFPVDEKTYISYRPQVENPNYTGTGTLQIEDKRVNYQVCKDGYSIDQIAVGSSMEEYNALLEKNPIRCFGEDKTYIYGRSEDRKPENSGYELMRIKK